MRDVDLLASLVHHKLLSPDEGRALAGKLKGGAELDDLLRDELGWSDEEVAKAHRTRGGELPEIPGLSVRSKLGVGGTASVFLARDTRAGRTLALKVLSPASTRVDATRKAFIAEARLLERLDHPGLVKGLGVARAGTTYFTKLEFIDGSTVLELLDQGHVFDESESLRIVLSVAETLRYLEREGVVHRDIKPGNIMIAKDGRVVLIDLGFAAEDGERAAAEAAVGTVQYLSPEQARGGAAADIRSDIYSLGISLFHMVVGHLPFESSDDREVLRMQVMDSLSSPELKSRGISPHVQYFIEKMVAKAVEDRYQDWSELIDDVRAQVQGRESLDFGRPG